MIWRSTKSVSDNLSYPYPKPTQPTGKGNFSPAANLVSIVECSSLSIRKQLIDHLLYWKHPPTLPPPRKKIPHLRYFRDLFQGTFCELTNNINMNPTPFRCPSKAKYQCLSWEGIPNMSQINLHILMTNCSYDHLCLQLSNLKI